MAKAKPLLLIMLILLLSRPALGAYGFEGNRFSFGFLSGYGFGFKAQDCLDCDSPRGWYQHVPVLFTGAYRFANTHSTRLSVGFDKYTQNSPFDTEKDMYIAAEGYYIYHFTDERKVFAPYGLAGFRVPKFNVGLGLGNEFNIDERFSVLLEAIITTFFSFDTRIEGRMGLVMHF